MLTGTGIIASGTYGYLSINKNNKQYQKLVAETWRHQHLNVVQQSLLKDVMNELVRCGTLAANSHNTQPWKFHIDNNSIEIQPDFSRRCPAVDPEDHHLYASLGCATENIVIAAQAFGLNAVVDQISSENSIRIQFNPTVASISDLYSAIPHRQCTRSVYTGEKIPSEQLILIKNTAEIHAVKAQIFTDYQTLIRIGEYVVEGNTEQMNDEAFIKELKHWVRFNKSMAIEYKDGLFSASSGNPEIPSWLGNLMFDMFFKVDTENEKYRKQINSSSAVMAFIAPSDDKQGWVNVGRSYQRAALQATALGLKHAFINQAVEVPAVRSDFAEFIGVGAKRPNLLIRLGYANAMPKSLRRPVDQVII